MSSTKKTPVRKSSPKVKQTSPEQEVLNQLEDLKIPQIQKITKNKSLLLSAWRLLQGVLKIFK